MSLFYSSLSETNGTDLEKPSPEEVLNHRKYLLGLLKQLRSQKQGVPPFQNAGLTPSTISGTIGENSTFVLTRDEQKEPVDTPVEGHRTRPGSGERVESPVLHSIQGSVDRIGQVTDDVNRI